MRPQAMYDRQLPAEFLEANPELASSAPNPSLPLPPLFLRLLEVLLASDACVVWACAVVSGPDNAGQLYPYEQTPGGTFMPDAPRIAPFMKTGTDPYA